jgi:hypothetical protein
VLHPKHDSATAVLLLHAAPSLLRLRSCRCCWRVAVRMHSLMQKRQQLQHWWHWQAGCQQVHWRDRQSGCFRYPQCCLLMSCTRCTQVLALPNWFCLRKRAHARRLLCCVCSSCCQRAKQDRSVLNYCCRRCCRAWRTSTARSGWPYCQA